MQVTKKNSQSVVVKVVYADPSDSWISLNGVGIASLSGGACAVICQMDANPLFRPQFISFAEMKAGETAIYIDPAMANALSDKQLKWIIGHELGHIVNDDSGESVPKGMTYYDHETSKELNADRYADQYAGKLSFFEKLKIVQAIIKSLVGSQISMRTFRPCNVGNFAGWFCTGIVIIADKCTRKRVLAMLK